MEQNIAVRRIKIVGFYINEALIRQNENDVPVKLELGLNLSFTIEADLVFLVVRVHYHYPDAAPTEIITDIQVQNVFEISGLKRFQRSATEIVLPPDLITTIVSLSVTHTRALLAQNILGTLFQDNLVAIVNPTVIAQHFFPNMFEVSAPERPMQEIINSVD